MMVKYKCVDCGNEFESAVRRSWVKRCSSCAGKVRSEGNGPRQQSRQGYKVIREGVGVRELKANPTELINLLEETPGLEIIITRYGKPSAKLVSLKEEAGDVPWEQRTSLRNTWSHMPDLTDEDFAKAKKIWEPRTDV